MSDETATGPTQDDAKASTGVNSPTEGGDPGKAKTPVRRPQGARSAARKASAGEATPPSAVRKPTSKRAPAKKTTPRRAAGKTTGTATGTAAAKAPAAPVAPTPEVPDPVLDEAAQSQQGSPEAASLEELVAQQPTVEELAAREIAARESVASELGTLGAATGESTAPGAVASELGTPAAATSEADPVAEGEGTPEAVASKSESPEEADRETTAPRGVKIQEVEPSVPAQTVALTEFTKKNLAELGDRAGSAGSVAPARTVPAEPEVPTPVVTDAPVASPTSSAPNPKQAAGGPKGAPKKKASPKPDPAVSPAATLPGAKGAQGAGYARDRFAALVGARVLRREKLPYTDALEIGAGATFGFSLGLLQSGVVNRLWISDLATSALTAARRRAEQLGLQLAGEELADPETLPFPEAGFDLVIAHAVLHRRMDPAGTVTEILRVLRPGGRFVITGESTRAKDWASPGFARAQGSVGRVGISRAGKARTLLPERLRTLTGTPDALPAVPDRLLAVATGAGAREVRVKPEELLATVLPYPGAEPAAAVVRSRQRLAVLDRKLSQVLPAAAFPTVGLTGIR
jgi:ubiquinone/menaquinone biosynthesis C-methylase UbiE